MKTRRHHKSGPDLDRAVARSLRGAPRTPRAEASEEQAEPGRESPVAHGRTQTLWIWLGGLVLAFLSVVVGIGGGAHVLGHGWQPLWLGVGFSLGVAGVGALAEAWPTRKTLGRGVRWGTTGLTFVLALSFIMGVMTTTVINGRPVWSQSQEAQVNAFADTTLHRLYRLGEVDAYFDLSAVDGRLHLTELEDAYREIEVWAVEYVDLRTEDLPAPELGEVELMMENATYHALAAIDARVQWLQTGDPVALRNSEEHRASMQQAVLEAGALLRDAAAVYGIVVGDAEGGLVE